MHARISWNHANVKISERNFRSPWIFFSSYAWKKPQNHTDWILPGSWVLLEVLDKVAPGVVNWRRANRPPFRIPLKKVENCNQAIEIGKNLKLSLVNVAGNDIVQKNKKLILGMPFFPSAELLSAGQGVLNPLIS